MFQLGCLRINAQLLADFNERMAAESRHNQIPGFIWSSRTSREIFQASVINGKKPPGCQSIRRYVYASPVWLYALSPDQVMSQLMHAHTPNHGTRMESSRFRKLKLSVDYFLEPRQKIKTLRSRYMKESHHAGVERGYPGFSWGCAARMWYRLRFSHVTYLWYGILVFPRKPCPIGYVWGEVTDDTPTNLGIRSSMSVLRVV